MIYLECQHCVKMIVMMQYDGMVSSFECSSDLTWHMFMHVNQNQHSLYDIYVHGVHILLMLVSNVPYA